MSSSYTPFPSASSQDKEENQFWLDRELSLIERALEDNGEMRRATSATCSDASTGGRGDTPTLSRPAWSRAASAGWAAGATRRRGRATSREGGRARGRRRPPPAFVCGDPHAARGAVVDTSEDRAVG